MILKVFLEISEQFFANSLPLTVDPDSYPEQIEAWDPFVAESVIFHFINREYSIADNCLCVFLTGYYNSITL